MVLARDALERLQEGNRRFAADDGGGSANINQKRRAELTAGQKPFATVLGCSDSRVPAEIIFDQGLGDLFVIRVAGNIATPSQIGSIEFAAEEFGTPLVVVLGHTMCGAILATMEELKRPTKNPSPNLSSIVDHLRPSVRALVENGLGQDQDALVRKAVRANISATAGYLRHGSQILERQIEKGGLHIVGAEYSLETGVVDFFDGLKEIG